MKEEIIGDFKQFIAATVTQQTSIITQRLDIVDGRLDKVEVRMDGLETKIDDLSISVAEAIDTKNQIFDQQFKIHE